MSDELPAGDGPAIRVRGLRNSFGEQVVHDNLDLDVRRGEIIGVVGGSGTGKSVLLRSILGLRQANAGTVRVFGEELLALPPWAEVFHVEPVAVPGLAADRCIVWMRDRAV